MSLSSPDVTPTLRALLERTALGLALVGTESALPPGTLDRTVRWVHSTDLADPTPFLADELVLLTTGTQLATGSSDEATEYVRRLTSRGVIALGFGTEVVRAGVPASLAAACAEAHLPLFEVPYRTPFIAVARANAEAVAAQAYARRSWALAAQRAIALAALRPDGLAATLSELAKQLGTWVALFDAAGSLSREYPADALTTAAHRGVSDEVQAVLRRGARAASALAIDGQPFTLQTLGRGGHLRGVIAIASSELDQEGRGVLTSVIAMAGLALEQHQSLGRARASLRAGVIEAMNAGQLDLARRVVRSAGDALPSAPVVVALTDDVARQGDAIIEWLELQAVEHPGALFFGESGDGLVIVVAAAKMSLLRKLSVRFEVRVGTSDPGDYADFTDSMAAAHIARSRGLEGVTTFADTHAAGVLGTLTDESRLVADSVLAPLRRADEETGSDLEATVRTFLDANGSAEAAAAALGVHRHTVRARIQAAERTLGMRLDNFAARAELWAAFVASGRS